MSEYRMHRAGFDRRSACHGHFNSDFGIEEVESDDGCDYVDWEALKAGGYPKDINYTYRIIDSKKVRFRNGERY